MAKETTLNKVAKAIESATNDFDYWASMEEKSWDTIAHAVKVQSIQSVKEAIQATEQARLNKEIASGKLIALRELQKSIEGIKNHK